MLKLLVLLPIIFAKKTPYKFANRQEIDSALDKCLQKDKTFKTCIGPNKVHIGNWDVSNVNNLASLFRNHELKHFSVDISRWDISSSDVAIRKPILK